MNGGDTNAFTDMESTNYHFNVANDAFKEGLDRFAQFFIAPLFTQDATAREMMAIESEHSKNIPQDMWRRFQLVKTSCNSSHPFHKFGTGNLETLDRIPTENSLNIRDELIKFHSKYYSANLMRLVISSNHSIETLVSWVSESFSQVKNMNVPLPSLEYVEQKVFTPSELTKFYKYVPIKDTKEMTLIFPIRIDDTTVNWMIKPDRYYSHYLGHEGEGSLFSYLKGLGLLYSLAAGVAHQFNGYQLFMISMRMTSEGEKQWKKVVSSVFEYLKLLREAGPQKHIFDETANLALAQFQYMDKRSDPDYISRLAGNMQKYPADKVMSASFLSFDYSPDVLNDYLNYIVPSNMNIYFASQGHEEEGTEEEKWYKIKYSKSDIEGELITNWAKGEHVGEPAAVKLVRPNPFIPQSFAIKQVEEQNPFPSLLRDNGKVKLWFKQDYVFKQPKVNIFYNLIIPESYTSPRVVVLSKLLSMLVADQLNEIAYEAEMAGVYYDIQSSVTGFTIYLSGYNDRIVELNHIVFEKFADHSFERNRFEVLKNDLTEQYNNMAQNQPYEHVLITSFESTYLSKWTYDQYAHVIGDITFEMLSDFVPQYLLCLKAEFLMIGNMNEAEALNLADKTEDILFGERNNRKFKHREPLPSQIPMERIVKLEEGKDYLVQKPVPNQNENSAIEVIYQIGLRNIQQDVILDLLAQIISTPFYSQLRTVEQLGYLVFSRARRDNNINSLSFIIQSDTKTPQFIQGRIDLFMQQFYDVLEQTSDEEISTHISGLRATIEEKDKHLKDEAVRFWREVMARQYLFDRAERKLEALATLKKSDLLHFFENYLLLSSQNCRRMIIQYLSQRHGAMDNATSTSVPENCLSETEKKSFEMREPEVLPSLIAEWKAGMSFYPGFTKY